MKAGCRSDRFEINPIQSCVERRLEVRGGGGGPPEGRSSPSDFPSRPPRGPRGRGRGRGGARPGVRMAGGRGGPARGVGGGDLGAAGGAAAAALAGAQAGAVLCGALVGAAAARARPGGRRREREAREEFLAAVSAADSRVAGSLGVLAAALAAGMLGITGEPSWGLCTGLCVAALPCCWELPAVRADCNQRPPATEEEEGVSATAGAGVGSPGSPETAGSPGPPGEVCEELPPGGPLSSFSFPSLSFSSRSSGGRSGDSDKPTPDSLSGVWEPGLSLGLAPWGLPDLRPARKWLRSRAGRSWVRLILAGASVGVALDALRRHKRGSRVFPFLLLWWPGGLDLAVGPQPHVQALRGVAAEAVEYVEKLRLEIQR